MELVSQIEILIDNSKRKKSNKSLAAAIVDLIKDDYVHRKEIIEYINNNGYPANEQEKHLYEHFKLHRY